MIVSLFPFFVLAFVAFACWSVVKCWRSGHKKTALVFGAVYLAIVMGGIRNQVSPDNVRADYEAKSFDRWNQPQERVVVDEKPFEERMDEKHDQW